MSARCASCSYPLSVCDSVACHECFSYFHIDCAQLVGFPLFELSAEPSKNTFRCSTCRLLPLPVHRGDTDSSDDEVMPSRQFDLTLEGDSGKDMNEVKGSIQDLSDLCKDMLREINDLKSINLTLRCCIENLRHDNEQRDLVISDLKKRLDLLEGKNLGEKITESSAKQDKSGKAIETEDDSTKLQINETLVQNISYDQKSFEINTFEDSQKQELFSNYTTSPKEETEGYELEETSTSFWEKDDDSQNDKLDSENKLNEDSEIGYSNDELDNTDEKRTENVSDEVQEVVKAEITNESTENRRDWSWRGSEAVEVEKEGNASEEEEYDSEEETDEKETPSWQKLKEEIESAMEEEEDNEETSDGVINKEPEENEEWKVRKSVRWDDNIEEETDSDTYFSQRGVESRCEEQSEAETETIADDYATDEGGSVAETEERSEIGDEERNLEIGDSIIEEEEYRLGTNENIPEEAMDSSELLAEVEARLEGEIIPTEGEQQLEREVTEDGEPRLEEGERVDEEPRIEGEETVDRIEGEVVDRLESEVTVERLEYGLTLEGEPRLEGLEFPEEEEVRPPEEEVVDPPESPEPEHTEEDLWLYLRENVSSVHPSTVEEFVQNLIGTLKHVPEEYLKPVIDANIKRANSPSVTDGDHLPVSDGIRPEEDHGLEEGRSDKNEEGNVTRSSALEEDFSRKAASEFPGGSTVLQASD